MINVELIKVERGGSVCSNSNCKNLEKHTVNIIGSAYHLRQGTTAARISLMFDHEIYCGGCIAEIYHLLKSKLDKKLWAFH